MHRDSSACWTASLGPVNLSLYRQPQPFSLNYVIFPDPESENNSWCLFWPLNLFLFSFFFSRFISCSKSKAILSLNYVLDITKSKFLSHSSSQQIGYFSFFNFLQFIQPHFFLHPCSPSCFSISETNLEGSDCRSVVCLQSKQWLTEVWTRLIGSVWLTLHSLFV